MSDVTVIRDADGSWSMRSELPEVLDYIRDVLADDVKHTADNGGVEIIATIDAASR